jgi:hypothetical protein
LFVARCKSSQIQCTMAKEQFVCHAASVLEEHDGPLL